MNKIAAEKIASEYYDLGIKLAHDKMASAFQKAFQKTINLGMGGTSGALVNSLYGQRLRDALAKSEYLKNVFAKGDASEALDLATSRLNSLGARGNRVLIGSGPSGTAEDLAKIIADSKATLGEGGMTALEKAVDVAPGLALAGGVALPIYKGLGKLDKKLKLY
jgi:hypothetical protein